MSFPFQYLHNEQERVRKLLDSANHPQGNPPERGEYWQEFTIFAGDMERAQELAVNYVELLSLGGIRGQLLRKFRQRRLETEINGLVSIVTRGDLDAYDDDIASGVLERPSANNDPYVESRRARQCADVVLHNLVEIVPENSGR